jgi:hypothetical protein
MEAVNCTTHYISASVVAHLMALGAHYVTMIEKNIAEQVLCFCSGM